METESKRWITVTEPEWPSAHPARQHPPAIPAEHRPHEDHRAHHADEQREEPCAELGGRTRERPVLRGRVERFGMLGVFLVDRIGEGGGRLPSAAGPP